MSGTVLSGFSSGAAEASGGLDAPDVGAYEWSGEGNPGWTVTTEFKVIGVEEETEVQGGCCGDKAEKSGAGALFLGGILGLGWRGRRRSVTRG